MGTATPRDGDEQTIRDRGPVAQRVCQDLAAFQAGLVRKVEGFAELAAELYDAMFTHAVGLPFATAEAPGALLAAFAELHEAVRPLAGDDDAEVLTETFWGALHGLVMLERGGRLPDGARDRRLALLVDRFAR